MKPEKKFSPKEKKDNKLSEYTKSLMNNRRNPQAENVTTTELRQLNRDISIRIRQDRLQLKEEPKEIRKDTGVINQGSEV